MHGCGSIVKLIVLVSFFLWGCEMGGIGPGAGPASGVSQGAQYGDANWGGGNTQGMTYGGMPYGGGASSGSPTLAEADIAHGSSYAGMGMMNGEPYGGEVMGPPSAPANAPSGGPGNMNYALQAANLISSFIPVLAPVRGGLNGLVAFAGDLLDGKSFSEAIGHGFTSFATSAIPFAGQIMGQLPRGQDTGETVTMGQGIPGDLQGMANALMGGGMEQGMVPGVGALGAGVQSGPGPQAAPSKAISPSPMAQNYYGMKRVNLPWVGWPQAQNREYGMKRV